MHRFDNLNDWLAWQETLNPAEIDLGLDRIREVMQQAGIEDSFDCPLIIVAGTNGKGSTVAFIEAIATQAGYRVAAYTSPHIHRYNERIRIHGEDISDAALCEAFERIDDARGEVQLTYFEFGTLAAIDLFHREVAAGTVDLVVMEIGLGGRLDAVNVMQPDVSVITSIALDHTDWLGDNREAIAREKAGVMRAGRTTIIGDWQPPDSLTAVANNTGARMLTLNHDMFIAATDTDWSLMVGDDQLFGLPLPALGGAHQLGNAACAIAALRELATHRAVLREHVDAGLRWARVPARCQTVTLDSGVQLLFDVAHNPEAIAALVAFCQANPVEGSQLLVLAMLRDKPVREVVQQLAVLSPHWFIAGLDVPRGLQVTDLKDTIEQLGADGKLAVCEQVEQACEQALDSAQAGDRIIVTGSFYTVAAAENWFANR